MHSSVRLMLYQEMNISLVLVQILKGCSESHLNSDSHLVADTNSSMCLLPRLKVEIDESFILNMN